MWYVIQTITGKEEELISLTEVILDHHLYDDCFTVKAEWMKRLGGKWQIQVRELFPGYIFIDTRHPVPIAEALKTVPKFTKMLGNGPFEFLPVHGEEERTLECMISRNEGCGRIIGLSELAADMEGKVVSIKGPLKYFKNNILKLDFHKRIATVKTEILGKERTLILGIKLKKDREE